MFNGLKIKISRQCVLEQDALESLTRSLGVSRVRRHFLIRILFSKQLTERTSHHHNINSTRQINRGGGSNPYNSLQGLQEVLREDVLEEVFSPDDAVDGFGRSVPDGAARESLLRGFGLTLVALCRPLQARKQGPVTVTLLFRINTPHVQSLVSPS